MKSLDEVVLDALDLHATCEPPRLELGLDPQTLVVASGNALPTAKILFAHKTRLFADESSYQEILDTVAVRRAAVISASGTKHAPILLADLLRQGIEVHLLTCDKGSPAARLLPPHHVIETPSQNEPSTYNTSTYLGMILAGTRENPRRIKEHLLQAVKPQIPDLTSYQAFYLVLPSRFDVQREMLLTKFDELFGGRVNGRCYTPEQTLHAKTLVPWDKELFVSFGYANEYFGERRLNLPLPEQASFAAMLATGYYFIGHIQDQFPPWFKQHVSEYRDLQRKLFQSYDAASGSES